jgi:hypothetical protein
LQVVALVQQAIDDAQLGRRQIHEQAERMQALQARRRFLEAKQIDHGIGSNRCSAGIGTRRVQWPAWRKNNDADSNSIGASGFGEGKARQRPVLAADGCRWLSTRANSPTRQPIGVPSRRQRCAARGAPA